MSECVRISWNVLVFSGQGLVETPVPKVLGADVAELGSCPLLLIEDNCPGHRRTLCCWLFLELGGGGGGWDKASRTFHEMPSPSCTCGHSTVCPCPQANGDRPGDDPRVTAHQMPGGCHPGHVS